MSYVIPEFEKEGFTCPSCNIYSKHDWKNIYGDREGIINIAKCQHCGKLNIWHTSNYRGVSNGKYYGDNNKLIYPKKSNIPLPNTDLDEDIINDYKEAINILNDSPRGAGGLLRLALQKLMVQLGEEGKNINTDIGNLVSKGLNTTIQQALDSVRVIGNEAVHPGKLDLKDDIDSVTKLFGLINFIADVLITQPKKIQELYGTLPEGKLEGIENRDK